MNVLAYEETLMTRLIWWIRRDLRLNDNAALHNALKRAESVIPVFILDDSLLKSERLNGPRAAWLFDGLRALDTDLRARGGRLILRSGNPSKVLAALAAEAGASGVCFNRDYSPYAVKRDQQVTETLRARGLQVESYADLLIHEPDEVFSASGKAYEVYTPFRRAWNGLAKPSVYRTLPQDLAKLRLPSDLVALPGLAILWVSSQLLNLSDCRVSQRPHIALTYSSVNAFLPTTPSAIF